MKNKKIMIEIIFICVAGLITIGLSVHSLYESDIKETELKTAQAELANANKLIISKQDLLIDAQNKIQEKTNEVIKLQGILMEKSDFQLKSIDGLKNPIPETLEVTFTSSVELSIKELVQIENFVKSTSSTHGNFLPFDSDKTIDGFEKINSFKSVMFQLNVSLHNKEKIMTISFDRGPLNLIGYNTPNSINAFILSFQSEKSVVMFDGFSLKTENITTNYKSPSLLDFENSKVSISYEFFFPEIKRYGSVPSIVYVSKNRDYLHLNFEFFSLAHKNYSLNITNLKRIEPNKFEGNCTIGKK